MSQNNVEAYKRGLEAFNDRDVEALLKDADPEVEWHTAMQALLEGEATVYRGHEGVRDAFRDFYGAFVEIRVEASEIRDLGDRIVAIGRLRTRGKESGVQTESPWGGMAEYKHGKAIRVWTYLDPREALDAAGLSE